MNRLRTTKTVAAALALALLAVTAWHVFRPPGAASSYPEMEERPPDEILARSESEVLASLPGSSFLAKEVGGDEVLDVLRKPDTATAFRLRDHEYQRSTPYDIPVVAGPFVIPPDTVRRLAEALGDARTYVRRWEVNPDGTPRRVRGAKGCEPDYGVRLRFERGRDVVDVFVCFFCAQISTFLNARRAGAPDFDPGQAELRAIARELFPGDPVIQALK